MEFKFAFLCALALFCTVHAESAAPACAANGFQNGSFAFVAVTLAVVSAAIGLAYMYSKAREDPALAVWAKDESYNLLISILLFAGIFAFVTGACLLSNAYVGQDPFDAATNYIDRLSTNNGLNIIKTLTSQSLGNQAKATAYLFIGLTPYAGSGAAFNANYRALSSHKEMLIDMYLPIIASLNAQKYVLQGIEWVSLTILLPFAFVLRLLPATRDFGNMMIAMFFAMYVIVPATYALSAQAFDSITAQGGIGLASINSSIFNFNSYGLDGEGTFGGDTVLYRVGSTIPQAVFIPNLVLIIAITATMSISKALKAFAA